MEVGFPISEEFSKYRIRAEFMLIRLVIDKYLNYYSVREYIRVSHSLFVSPTPLTPMF